MKPTSIQLDELTCYLNTELNIAQFKDYCPNGLQVEGKAEVKKIVTGVTASQALIDAAIAEDADAILVHHGYFWKGEPEAIVGMKKKRIQSLLKHDISLLGYHLPLDSHPEWGNNVQLAKVLNLSVDDTLDPFDPRVPGNIGKLPAPMSGHEFAQYISKKLNRAPQHIGDPDAIIKTVAWCTGGAQGYMHYAINQGIDAFISGEISEPSFHNAQETGVHYYAAGHHATERYGAKALGEHLAEKFGLDVVFIDIDNPV